MRLHSYLKIYGNLTKEEIKSLSLQNKITVNDKILPLSWIIKDSDTVKIENQIIQKIPYSYFLYNKPIGIRCDITKSDNSYINNLGVIEKLMPVGRLDVLSHGLVILTNDGAFINKITSNKNLPKTYIVSLQSQITPEFLEDIKKPMTIKGKTTLSLIPEVLDEYTIKLTLFSGRYHEIRRKCIKCKNKVIDLYRISIGPFEILDLEEGKLKKIKDPYSLLS